LAGGSCATILPDGTDAATSVLNRLTINDGGTLDINDNALIVDHAGDSPAATIRQKILEGRGGSGIGNATWVGTGITSTKAAQTNATAPDSRSVGYAENALLPLGPYATFRGHAVDATSVLIAYTRSADANLDGVVDDDDVTIVGATYAPTAAQPIWAMGDFDYNGFVDDDDVTLLGALYDPGAMPVAATPHEGPEDRNAVAPAVRPGTVRAFNHARSEGPTPVAAWSPDRGAASTAGLSAIHTRAETFGQAHERGQETRAQHRDPLDLELLDLLAESHYDRSKRIEAELVGRLKEATVGFV
jgi:hypothetical protein